jgi:hypothetical protein
VPGSCSIAGQLFICRRHLHCLCSTELLLLLLLSRLFVCVQHRVCAWATLSFKNYQKR